MRILQLKLTAFGPFTNVVIELGEPERDFHLVYGRNEAGKSSALRGLKQALFGIPLRTADNFLHPHLQMRVGCVLEHSDGSRIDFVRRKGRSNTLRAGDDKDVLDDTALDKFLGGISEEVFETMFGLGHEDLVRGGHEIIKGSGKIGQVLFAAASGISDLRQVQLHLQKETEELFAPSASKRAINLAFSELERNRKRLKEAELPAAEWLEHNRALKEALYQKEEANREFQEKTNEKSRLERIRDGLPLIGRRKELLEQIKSYADALILPEDFGKRRISLLSELRSAQGSVERSVEALKEIEKETARHTLSEPILRSGELIEQLHQQLGSHRKAARDRVVLVREKDLLRSDAGEILSRLSDALSLEEVSKLRPKRAQMAYIEELGSEYERLMTKREGVEEEIAKLTSSLARIQEEIKSLGTAKPVSDLVGVVDQAQEYASLETHRDSEQLDIHNLEEVLRERLAQQPLGPDSIEEVPSLSIPSFESMDKFEKEMGDLDSELRRVRAAMRDAEQDLIRIQRNIESLRLEQEVPTEEDLAEARKLRDRGWAQVRQTLQGGVQDAGEVTDFIHAMKPAGSLADAYEAAVQQADEIGDRLRREADRVAAMAKLLADEKSKKAELELLEKELQDAREAMNRLRAEWKESWKPSGIEPLSPREMRAWAQEHLAISQDLQRLKERKAKLEGLTQKIEKYRKDLDQRLQSLGEPPSERESLSALVKKTSRLIKAQEERTAKRESLLAQEREKKAEVKRERDRAGRLDARFQEWKDQWKEALRPFGLDSDATPTQARAFLEGLKDLFEKLKEAENLQERINGIDRDADQFAEELAGLVERVAPDLVGQAPEQQALELNARLKQAREARAALDGLEKQGKAEKKKLEDAWGNVKDVKARLETMCQEAGCSTPEQLGEAERRSEVKRKLVSDLEEVEKQLRNLAKGATIDAFAAQAEEVDPDTLEGRLARLTESIEELREKRSSLDQTIGSERAKLSKWTGSASAAELAEERQQILARLEAGVENYARLRIASAVLARAIERYREKHQGPVLELTNKLFSRLTLGSFQGIRPEYDERGEPVLMGVRQGGQQLVTVEGMSDGTVDQLYLALRLASLESYLERNEPMPFIVDDILIRFDNDRAMAALEVLADLSRKTQVIFFTHHSHLVELAEKTLGPMMPRHSLGLDPH
ncbi:MAG: AAA family ATPase [Deltaproteobacteria bacterium]|nr:AAA family ATPase [Deltaproteobacteria bacterium]MBW2008713.1 AAA family ATPase [Deltaproteobacteria bacterium]